jgi:hypothetical protein
MVHCHPDENRDPVKSPKKSIFMSLRFAPRIPTKPGVVGSRQLAEKQSAFAFRKHINSRSFGEKGSKMEGNMAMC